MTNDFSEFEDYVHDSPEETAVKHRQARWTISCIVDLPANNGMNAASINARILQDWMNKFEPHR